MWSMTKQSPYRSPLESMNESSLAPRILYKKAAGITLKLAEVAAESSTAALKDRMKVLDTVLEKEVSVAVVQ